VIAESTIKLLSRLRDLHIGLAAENGTLRYSAPAGALNSDLRRQLSEHKTEILQFLEEASQSSCFRAPSITPAGRDASLPVSFAQLRLLLLERLTPGTAAYNICSCLRLLGPLHVGVLEQSLTEIVRRHEILRTSFRIEDGEPVQHIAAPGQFEIRMVDLRSLPESDRNTTASGIRSEEARHSFDLNKAPLIRAALLRLGTEEHLLVVTVHHIVFDGWSFGVFYRELTALYQAFLVNSASPLPELPIQYADFAVWQRRWLQGEILDAQLNYWRENLKGAQTVLELPADHPRPAIESFHGAVFPFRLSRDLSEQVNALCHREGVTLFVGLLSAFQVLLLRYTGQEDILVGTPIANRNRSEVEDLIGFFVNTLVMRGDLSGDPTFRELLARIQETALEAYAHQDLPFEKLVEGLAPKRDLSRGPIFQVFLAFQNTPMQPLRLPGVEVRGEQGDSGISKFDLSLYLTETTEGLSGTIEFNTDLFDSDRIQRMAEHFRVLLESIAHDPDQRLSELQYLTAQEMHLLVADWNDTGFSYPHDVFVDQLFAAHAREHPERVALTFQNQTLTYGALNVRANRLARYMQTLGVGPEKRVAICVERGFEMVIAVLAVLKAGGAYVPLDPSYPIERLRLMLEDSQPMVLLADWHTKPQFADLSDRLAMLDLTGATPVWATEAGIDPDAHTTDSHPAYVIYTSGSTGTPKGVEILRSALVNLLLSMQRELKFLETDTLLALTTLCFDIAGLELFLPLITGGRMVIAGRDDARDPSSLMTLVRESACTYLQATPTTWHSLIQSGWEGSPGLKAISGGEPMSRELAAELLGRSTEVWNAYGPTETTIWSTLHKVSSGNGPVPIGKPIANTKVYVLDAQRRLVGVGVIGELYIAGDGVARGYLNRDELTRERFVPDPFLPGNRMYRTGDLARWLPDGTLECLGRVDNQVKLRGFRIELSEIETHLSKYPALCDAAVIAREDTPGDKRLVGYFTAIPDATDFHSDQLRAYLSTKIPGYMVPTAYVRMHSLPRTPNGKLDRKALPLPDLERSIATDHEPPSGELETELAKIWSEVLGRSPIGRHDNFFDIGGHSMLAMKLISRINVRFGVDLPTRTPFQAQTIAQIARLINQRSDPASKNDNHAWDILIPINTHGSRIPLFCVSRPNVNALGYAALARALGQDQPTYGLQSQMEVDPAIDFSDDQYRAAAQEYIQAMKKVQPHGPYYLIGQCQGSYIGFEMVRQLESLGEEVAFWGVLDTWTEENTRVRWKFHLSEFCHWILKVRLAQIARTAMSLFRSEPLVDLPAPPPALLAIIVRDER
jgi:amino acid adenylation domain-containing protein